jgi:dipeptidyl aminopeptidase/acylaminoacyl peptidase
MATRSAARWLFALCIASSALLATPILAQQQDSPQQRRGAGFAMQGVYKYRVTPHWFHDNTRFWYRNDLRGGAREFIVVDADAGTRVPAFDHERLAAALSKALDQPVNADHLPFDAIEFADNDKSVRFTISGKSWKCDLGTYDITQSEGSPVVVPQPGAMAPALDPPALALLGDPHASPYADDEPAADTGIDATEFPSPQETQPTTQADNGRGGRGGRGGIARGGGGRGRGNFGGGGGANQQVASPDGKATAFLRDNNVFLRDSDGKEIQITKDGSAEFTYRRLSFAPDGTTLVAFRMEPGDRKVVYRLESSPRVQGPSPNGGGLGGVGRAVLHTDVYALPGDKFDSYELNLFDLASQKQTKPQVDRIDMSAGGGDPTPAIRWRRDGFHFTYEKYDRGHQRVRIIEVDAHTGATRNVLDEQSKTFIWTAHTENLVIQMISYLRNEDEILYVSEMDGWRHLYLIDEPTGKLTQITKGPWIVRGVNLVDQDARQIWFSASGVYPDQDPYLVQYGRINFDGTGLTWLTSGNGNHNIDFADNTGSFSPDNKYVIDTYGRVDMAPITELRRVSDGKLVCPLEKADVEVDWNAPEVFTAKGRDGTTDIWGIILRPKNFDPAKKYPVIENIYAGPQGSFVPKTFSPVLRGSDAGLVNDGFIVVHIDGMGTANRSKAFHDVCWHHLNDGGFADRILWMKAAAAKYPYMDLDRVGIFGTSAGGQDACAAVLFHPDFYKVAVANSGCHDNRMDKASWNEQWMGYPVGPQYSECSNIDHAANLKGHLQLVLGEMDSNVPVESTFRLVNALTQARRDFEFVFVPGADHGAASPVTERKLEDFFIRYLQGTEPPNHNQG